LYLFHASSVVFESRILPPADREKGKLRDWKER
jgi:hypothetical protein